MALEYHYQNAIGSSVDFDIVIDKIRLGELGFVQEGGLGATGTSGIVIDDAEGALEILAWQRWYVLETACRASAVLTGTVDKDSTSTTLTGHSSAFLTQLTAGDEIAVPGGGGTDYVIVASVETNTSATLYLAPSNTATGQTATRSGKQHLWDGLTGDQDISRGSDRAEGGEYVGAARDWAVDLADTNAILHLRQITDSTTGHNRPTETVAARLAWLLATTEVTSLLIADEGQVTYPTDSMGGSDLHGEFIDDVLNDMAQVCGRNFSLVYHEATGNYQLIFKKPETYTTPSPCRFTNDPADLSTANTYEIGQDAKVHRSGLPVISGEVVTYSRAMTYRTKPSTLDTFGYRDGNAPSSKLKTLAQAQAYGDRDLAANASQDETFHLSAVMPAANVNDVLLLQVCQAKATHLPGWTVMRWGKVIRREVRQHMAKGKPVPGYYMVTLDLTPANSPSGCGYGCTDSVTNYPLGGDTDFFNPVPADGIMYMLRPGLSYPFVPTPGYIGRWYFKVFGSSSGGIGTIDYAGDLTGNTLRAIVIGNGTLTVQTELYTGPTYQAVVNVKRQVLAGTPTTEATYFDTISSTTIDYGDAYVVTIDDADDDLCISLIDLTDIGVEPGNSKLGWSSAVWESAGCGGGG